MNCTEFRQQLMREPTCTDLEFLQHVSDCNSCSVEYDRALEFEAMLLHTMKVETPDNLEKRVLHTVEESKTAVSTINGYRPQLFASIMLLLLVIGWIGLQWGGQVAYAENLPQVVSQHIERESGYLHKDGQLSEAVVVQLFSRFGAVMHGSVGTVVFAEPCWVRHQQGVHLILAEAFEPVTLMFMPGEHIVHAQGFVWGQYSGKIYPTDYGSLAIVATTTQTVERLHQRISDSLMWGA